MIISCCLVMFTLVGKARRFQNFKSKISRILNRSPEVMVKVTGGCKGIDGAKGHLMAHLSYITRAGDRDLEFEDESGMVNQGVDALKKIRDSWLNDQGVRPITEKTRHTMNMVFSMPNGTPEDAVIDATRDTAQQLFAHNHEYIFVYHDDEDHPHVHLTLKRLGFNGKRIVTSDEDLQHYRETFAENLRAHGVDAEAHAKKNARHNQKASFSEDP